MKCISCGATINKSMAFCEWCGSPVQSRQNFQSDSWSGGGSPSQPWSQAGSSGGVVPTAGAGLSVAPLSKRQINRGRRKGKVALALGIISIVASIFGVFGAIVGLILGSLISEFVGLLVGFFVGSLMGILLGVFGIRLGKKTREILPDEYHEYYVALAGVITGSIGLAFSIFVAAIMAFNGLVWLLVMISMGLF